LWNRKAFLERYWKDVPGGDQAQITAEMQDAADIVMDLCQEYEACESADYIKWGADGPGASSMIDDMMTGMRM
jgi:tubulin gamma